MIKKQKDQTKKPVSDAPSANSRTANNIIGKKAAVKLPERLPSLSEMRSQEARIRSKMLLDLRGELCQVLENAGKLSRNLRVEIKAPDETSKRSLRSNRLVLARSCTTLARRITEEGIHFDLTGYKEIIANYKAWSSKQAARVAQSLDRMLEKNARLCQKRDNIVRKQEELFEKPWAADPRYFRANSNHSPKEVRFLNSATKRSCKFLEQLIGQRLAAKDSSEVAMTVPPTSMEVTSKISSMSDPVRISS